MLPTKTCATYPRSSLLEQVEKENWEGAVNLEMTFEVVEDIFDGHVEM